MQVWGNKNSLYFLDFPGSSVDKNPPADARDMDSTPDWGRFHRLQSSKSQCTATAACTLPLLRPTRLGGLPGGLVVENPPASAEDKAMQVRSLDGENPLEEEMATHSRILAWKIPGTVQPGGPQSMGVTKSQTRLATERACMYTF